MHKRHAHDDITGLILAGGQGTRMGGADKGLVEFRGKPLIEYALTRLAPQVGRLVISANRNTERYAALGAPVVTDLMPDFPGPLAGLLAGLHACRTPRLVCVPCDVPRFPVDLAARLTAALDPAPAAYAVTPQREHPIFLACGVHVRKDLEATLKAGERRVGAWLAHIGAVPVSFDDETAFANFNRHVDLA